MTRDVRIRREGPQISVASPSKRKAVTRSLFWLAVSISLLVFAARTAISPHRPDETASHIGLVAVIVALAIWFFGFAYTWYSVAGSQRYFLRANAIRVVGRVPEGPTWLGFGHAECEFDVRWSDIKKWNPFVFVHVPYGFNYGLEFERKDGEVISVTTTCFRESCETIARNIFSAIEKSQVASEIEAEKSLPVDPLEQIAAEALMDDADGAALHPRTAAIPSSSIETAFSDTPIEAPVVRPYPGENHRIEPVRTTTSPEPKKPNVAKTESRNGCVGFALLVASIFAGFLSLCMYKISGRDSLGFVIGMAILSLMLAIVGIGNVVAGPADSDAR